MSEETTGETPTPNNLPKRVSSMPDAVLVPSGDPNDAHCGLVR